MYSEFQLCMQVHVEYQLIRYTQIQNCLFLVVYNNWYQ